MTEDQRKNQAGPAGARGTPGRTVDRALPWLIVLVVAWSAARHAHDVLKALIDSRFIDFAHFYTFATIVAYGQDAFDPAIVARADQALGVRRAAAPANAPPFFYVLMQPWVVLPFRPAAVLWTVAGQVLLAFSLAWCFARHRGAATLLIGATLFIALNFQPAAETLVLGQSNFVLLFLVAWAWRSLRRDQVWRAAVAVGLAAHVKPQFLLLLPLLWWMGRRGEALRAIAVTIAAGIVGFVWLGPMHHAHYVAYIADMPPYLRWWTANHGVRATVYRLLGGPAAPTGIAEALSLLFVIAIVVVTTRAIPRAIAPASDALDWAWGLGVCTILMTSPLTEEHHMVVLLLPLALLILVGHALPRRDQALLLAAIVLLAARYSLEQFPRFHAGWLSLLATGKLMGVVVLATLLRRRLRAAEPA